MPSYAISEQFKKRARKRIRKHRPGPPQPNDFGSYDYRTPQTYNVSNFQQQLSRMLGTIIFTRGRCYVTLSYIRMFYVDWCLVSFGEDVGSVKF